MKELQSINSEIFDLRQKQLYKEALEVYKEKVHNKFSAQQIKDFDYLVANVLFCLRKTDQQPAAVKFVDQSLQLQPNWQTHPGATAEYGWSLYSLVKNTRADDLLSAIPPYIVKAARLLPTIKTDRDYLLFRLLFQELSRKLMLRGPAAQLLAETIDPMEHTCFKGPEKTKQPGTPVTHQNPETASDLETFLVRKAKVMLLTSQYEKCIDASNKAFELIEKFHHGNHIWLARNMAVSMQQTGNLAKAIEKMEQITRRKKDWFLFAELASMQIAAGNNAEGIVTICQAALQQGHSEFKAGLYQQIGLDYQEFFSKEIVCQHLWLAIKTRQEKGWKLPEPLQDFQAGNNCEELDMTSRQMYQKLAVEWSKITEQHRKAAKDSAGNGGMQSKGTVTRILNEGENGDGFITTTDGISIYFRMKKVTPLVQTLAPGTQVETFAREREYKGNKVFNALWVKIIG